MIHELMQTGTTVLTAAAGTGNVSEKSVSDVIDTATEVTGDAAQDVNQFFQLIQDNIPNIVGFGIRVPGGGGATGQRRGGADVRRTRRSAYAPGGRAHPP